MVIGNFSHRAQGTGGVTRRVFLALAGLGLSGLSVASVAGAATSEAYVSAFTVREQTDGI